MQRTTTFFLLILFFVSLGWERANAQQSQKEDSKIVYQNSVPFVGAQVFIEPGQTKEEIDTWFKRLKENHMTVCRIRMFESYMRDENYNWDFSLFDQAFEAADKYGIRVYATLFPYTAKTDIGGFKFPRDEEHLKSIATFIEKLVSHFKSYESLAGWVLLNEPGTGGSIPDNTFSAQKFSEWKDEHPVKEYGEKGYPVLVGFSEERFLLDYETWFLNWISDEIKKYDTQHDIHVNSHAIFNNCAEYNFPKWRKFLTSLGGSAHASWHFSYFSRQQYAVAMSANSEMIFSGAGSLPWFMTELQGGNNTYSGGTPLCPTKEEIAQWLWIIFATQGKGAIFWTLNPRASGIEAGEWALLDFQDNPSDRMTEAGQVAQTIQKNASLFAKAKKVDSHISILYARESLWAESHMVIHNSNYEARNKGGVMKSALGYFEALSEMGVVPNLKAFNEFNFSKSNYSDETIILSHQISLPKMYVDSLENFVAKGGKLIVDGLTAFYDENMINTMKTGFDFEQLFGGDVSEFKLVDNIFKLDIDNTVIPAHLWKGFVKAEDGQPLIDQHSDAIGIRNKWGKGEVIWVPSLLGLGSRIEKDYTPLQKFLKKENSQSLANLPVQFQEPRKNVLMKIMQSGNDLITVLVNKNSEAQTITLDFHRKGQVPKVIFPASHESVSGNKLRILPEETLVIGWK